MSRRKDPRHPLPRLCGVAHAWQMHVVVARAATTVAAAPKPDRLVHSSTSASHVAVAAVVLRGLKN